jgi:hypothetical protein
MPFAKGAKATPTSFRARTGALDAMRLTYALLLAAALTSCNEYREVTYPDLAKAKEDGAIERGWIPEWLPQSSVQFYEAHDLDSNRSALSVRFSANESWNPPSSCKQIPHTDVPESPIHPSWWPNDIPPSALATYRHAFYSCAEKGYLAVSQLQGELYYWRPNGI